VRRSGGDTDDGGIERIVEQKDATEDEQAILEINSGIYVFDVDTLRGGLASLSTDNAQGRALPHRRGRLCQRAGRPRGCLRDRRPLADRGPTTGCSSRR
jgi:hypothetical protein